MTERPDGTVALCDLEACRQMAVWQAEGYASVGPASFATPVRKIAHWVPISDWLYQSLRYGWMPPHHDPNPMPRFRIWRWWPTWA